MIRAVFLLFALFVDGQSQWPVVAEELDTIYVATYKTWSYAGCWQGALQCGEVGAPELIAHEMYLFWDFRPDHNGKLKWRCVDYYWPQESYVSFDPVDEKWCVMFRDCRCSCWRIVKAPVFGGGTWQKSPLNYGSKSGRKKGPWWWENMPGLKEPDK